MDKFWLKSYPPGVPADIDYTRYRSLVHLLEEAFDKYAQRNAYVCMDRFITYADVDLMSKKLGAWLQSQGLSKGARVALMMPNVLQYPVAIAAVLRAGYVVVNVNPLYTARELEHQLKDSGAEAIIILENFASVLEKVIARTQVKVAVVASMGDLLGGIKGSIVNFVVRTVKKMVPEFSLPNAVRFNRALSEGASLILRPVELDHHSVAFLQYTGGTTGVAKGAVLTHKNIVANMVQARAWIKNLITDGKEIIITPLPLYHIFSLTANCFIFNSVGALNVLITNPRDIPGFVKELKKWKFTAITGVNTLFNGLLNNEEFNKLDFSHLKVSLGGGMAVQKAVAEKWKKVTGRPLIEAYGLTETSPAACINPMTLKDYNGFIGLPLPSTEVEIKDDNGATVPMGEIGEICIRGPQVMAGYYNRPDETAKVMTKDGFFKTGDLGFMNEQGYSKIVDRKKDMILVSGFNVYPNELEDVITQQPKVLECAAIGIPDEKSGEVVKVFVVKKDQSLTQDELMKFCRENLTSYKIPKYIEFRAELPKSNVGKILRKDLRAEEVTSNK